MFQQLDQYAVDIFLGKIHSSRDSKNLFVAISTIVDVIKFIRF